MSQRRAVTRTPAFHPSARESPPVYPKHRELEKKEKLSSSEELLSYETLFIQSQKHPPKWTRGGDAGLSLCRGDQGSRLPARRTFSQRASAHGSSAVSSALTFHSAGGMWNRRSGLAKEMAGEKSAHSHLSLRVKTAQPAQDAPRYPVQSLGSQGPT